jgi:hypothetical protein
LTSNAFWQQGEVQAGRSLARPYTPFDSWAQQVLVPPDVLEVRLRLGLIPYDHHGRWLCEVIDPTNRELLAMASMPHFDLRSWEQEAAGAFNRLCASVEDFLNPDPFP